MLRSGLTAPLDAAGGRWRMAYVDAVREWVAAGQAAWLPIRGASMEPAIPDGSRLLVVARPASAIGPGALVVFEREGRLVCHRVLGRHRPAGERVFLVKGDARPRFDPWVPETHVLAEVIAIEHDGHRLDLTAPRRRARARAAAAWSWLRGGSGTLGRRIARWCRPGAWRVPVS